MIAGAMGEGVRDVVVDVDVVEAGDVDVGEEEREEERLWRAVTKGGWEEEEEEERLEFEDDGDDELDEV